MVSGTGTGTGKLKLKLTSYKKTRTISVAQISDLRFEFAPTDYIRICYSKITYKIQVKFTIAYPDKNLWV
jgi:hypothetical protein